MSVYIVSFILNMLLGTLLIPNKSTASILSCESIRKRKVVYLFLTTIQLGLLCGFRSTKMAYDTAAYEMIFELAPGSWNHIFDKSSYVEVGFRMLCSIIKIAGGDYQTLLIVAALFTMGSCCIFIYRHSKDVLFSVFIILCFPFFYSAFDIIRHFLATAFLLLGYKYAVEQKPIKYLFFIVLGSLFHSIAWLFVPLYFLKNLKWNWLTAVLSSIITLALYIYIVPISIWISDMLEKGDGVSSGWIGEYGGGVKTAIMYGIIFLIAVFAYFQFKEKNKEDDLAVNYTLLMLIFSILFINARMFTRLIMTMVPFLAIAIPQLLDKSRFRSDKDYYVLKIGTVFLGLIYHGFMLLTNWQNVVPYIPYWR